MRAILFSLVINLFFCVAVKAQQVDSIYFHLYTDSLKKGTYNYINVDGKTRDGHWLPLGEKQIVFTSSDGRWEGNSLVIDQNFSKDSVIITAILKQDTTVKRTVVIYIKQKPDDEKLKTEQEILNEWNSGNKKSKRRG